MELGKEKYYSNPETRKEMKRTIEVLIQKEIKLEDLATEVFQKPHFRKWTDEFKDELRELVAKLEPTKQALSSALLADHDYPFGDPEVADPKLKYTRLTEDERQKLATVPEHSTLLKRVLRWVRKKKPWVALLDQSFEKAWIDPRGLIWGGLIRREDGSAHLMDFDSANAYCKKIGARVATKREWKALSKDMGYGSDAGYIPRYLPNLYGRHFWSSSRDRLGERYGVRQVFYFFGTTGEISSVGRNNSASVRCVVAP